MSGRNRYWVRPDASACRIGCAGRGGLRQSHLWLKRDEEHAPQRDFVASVTLPRFSGGFAADQPKVQILPVSQVKAGMHGVAYTVFEGTTPEPMEVEILGVLRNMAGPKSDVILARLHGKKVEYTGVVAGMSGSPVYIDGKLVGAIAYRIGEFSKEPIAGITPAATMLEIDDMDKTPAPDLAQGAGARKAGGEPHLRAGRTGCSGSGGCRLRQSPETDRDSAGLHRIQRRYAAAVLQGFRLCRRRSGHGRWFGQQRQAA